MYVNVVHDYSSPHRRHIINGIMTTALKLMTTAFSLNAELVGVASADQLNGAPEDHRPTDLLSDARSIIIVACGRRLNVKRHCIGKIILQKLSVVVLGALVRKSVTKMVRSLENKGFKVVIEWAGWSGILSFRRAAYYAGLGVFGKGGFVIHPKHGSLNILACIVTNAPLKPGSPLSLDLCGVCTKCLEICEYGAITQHGFNGQRCQYTMYDVHHPYTGERKPGPCNAKCINTCPIGK